MPSEQDVSDRLDAREIDGEPFGTITAALDDLAPGESLLLINTFEPVPLYGVLDERGFAHDATRVDEEEWHVEITNSTAE
ncbi:DUF2249 domain-containing protein [Salinarchaeum laminariae]|uniref:DUF2249 domain-containing protein n=1 Tax=Salinarchaeum laminariae TaxID=869888 RepID=UPI0020BF77D4|nr:DUF2249 domain-containing protein [Salinarchaeum laminariae]